MKPYFSRTLSTPVFSDPEYSPKQEGSLSLEQAVNVQPQKVEPVERNFPRAGNVSRSVSLPFLAQSESRPPPLRTPISRVSIPPAFAGL